MRAIALVLLAACGDSIPPDDPVASELAVRTIATFAPEGEIALAPLDEHRIAVARRVVRGDAVCPDCVDLDPSECPSICERTEISVSVLEATTGALDMPRPLAPVFPRTFDHSVDQLEILALGGERVGIAWLDCDNATCLALAAKRSCTARYTTMDLATGALGPIQTLYDGWFGDLSLGFEPSSRQVLALVAKDLAMGSGIFRAVFDETGATTISPWAPLGSTAARSPAIVATGGELLVIADDWSPAAPPLATPCTQSCDCLGAGPIDLDQGGLFAFHIGTSDRVERIAGGTDERGFYTRRQEIAAIDTGDQVMIATTQSIDRFAEIFTYDGATWTAALQSQAPIPTWIGALGTADHLAWLGSQPVSPEMSSVQSLVAGVLSDRGSTRAEFTEPSERIIYRTAPVVTPAGVTTTYLTQAVLSQTTTDPTWERWEVLAIDADWR